MLNGIGKDSQDFSSDFERSDTFLNSSLQSEVLSVLDFRLQLTSLNIGCTRDSWSKLRSPLIGTIFRDNPSKPWFSSRLHDICQIFNLSLRAEC